MIFKFEVEHGLFLLAAITEQSLLILDSRFGGQIQVMEGRGIRPHRGVLS